MANTPISRTVGIIGGMSWESTATYYAEINRRYHEARGGHHSAPVVIHSVDFAPIEAMQRSGDWDGTAEILESAAIGLERAGAGTLLLATNTMHLVFDRLVAATGVPWIHIADATGTVLRRDRVRRVGLLGTRFTMEEPFYRERIAARFGLEVLVPGADDRRTVDRVIFDELVHGELRDDSRRIYRDIMKRLAAGGAEAMILGCTEIGLLVFAADSPVPIYDTTLVHAQAAVDWLLADEGATGAVSSSP